MGRHARRHAAAGAVSEPASEERLAAFTDLVATAVANTQARAEVERLADEQAALRRVATLVARGTEPVTVFRAVCNEAQALLGATWPGSSGSTTTGR